MFLVFLVSASTFLWSCDKAKDTVQPDALTATQVQTVKSGKDKEDKDNKYKTDKIGQYVSKDVQVTGYEDGRERPTRPKYDVAGDLGAYSEVPCDPCGPGSGGVPTPPTSTFVSSESLGGYGVHPYQFPENLDNYIQDLKIIKGSSSSIGVDDPGYYKIPVDLNRGAGGKYIYLCFTRDPSKVKGSDSGSSAWVNNSISGKFIPVKNIIVKSYDVGGLNGWPSGWCSPPIEVKDALGYHTPDLNDGASGKYIYAYQEKCNPSTPIREVGVIYGNSSTIQPPYPWIKVPGDLNQGAGGDYIYFCVKY